MTNWLGNAVVYEIYPQSFYDTNGDGIGDLRGVIEKLDYIEDCGFTAIWLNPINESAFLDAGYDVTDFYKVAERYGTNEDYKELCDEAHKRGMKVIFDLVAGHTSVYHPWFIESAKAERNEYTDRYIWTTSTFGVGEGLSGYAERDGNYFNNFFWHQPSLNYGYAAPDPNKPWQLPPSHPVCRATLDELKKIIGFWMDFGTDGFRVDMAASLIKEDKDGKCIQALWGEVKDFIHSKNPECLLISEWGFPKDAINANFDLDFLLHSGQSAYTSLFRYEKGRNTTAKFVGNSYFNKNGKGNISEYLNVFMNDLGVIKNRGYIGHITGNHDIPRLAFKRTVPEIKCAMAFLFTMPGVPFVYYGDEIGMDFIEGLPTKEGGYIRTGARTPMQWNDDKNHGFSTSDTPYLPTDERDGAPTVEGQINDKDSLLSFTKQLIKLHKENKSLWADSPIRIINEGYPFVFERGDGENTLLVAINPSDNEYTIPSEELVPVLTQNIELADGMIKMNGVSLFIGKKI